MARSLNVQPPISDEGRIRLRARVPHLARGEERPTGAAPGRTMEFQLSCSDSPMMMPSGPRTKQSR